MGNILNLLTIVFQGNDVNTDDEQGGAQAVEIDYFFLVENILNLLTVVFQGIDVNTDDEQGRAQAVEREK